MRIVTKLVCVLFLSCSPLLGYGWLKSMEQPVELERGISIGNVFESPKGENWGVDMHDNYLDLIKDAGFDTVRIPVRFSDYFDESTNKIDSEFLKTIDYYIKYGLSLGLNVILDLHHFAEITSEPENYRGRFMEIWRQLSIRYMNYPNKLVFEILNEPHNKLKNELWNEYLKEVISIIRETNLKRLIIVGPDRYNSIDGLETLELPDDKNIVVTFHYYNPTEFTFQGNPHHKGYEHISGIKWTGDANEIKQIRNDFQKAQDWANRNNVKIFLGEFGSVNTIPNEYRTKWTSTVIKTAEEMGFSWSYWELCSWFGILDPATHQWDQDMLQILTKE